MKAYECQYENGYGVFVKFYWAETPGKAKAQALCDEELGEPENFIDIYAHRIPWADNLDNASSNEFYLESIKHGYDYVTYDENGMERYLSKKDVPTLEKIGGSINKFWKLYDQGKIKYDDKGISYLVNDKEQ